MTTAINRRHFAALLPALLASPAAPSLESQAPPIPPPPSTLPALASGDFPAFTPPAHFDERAGHRYFLGMLPNGIRFESHITYLQPGAPHEAVGTHKHSEMWIIREGQAELNLNGVAHMLAPGAIGLCVAGDKHYIRNAGAAICSYYVIALGPQEE